MKTVEGWKGGCVEDGPRGGSSSQVREATGTSGGNGCPQSTKGPAEVQLGLPQKQVVAPLGSARPR